MSNKIINTNREYQCGYMDALIMVIGLIKSGPFQVSTLEHMLQDMEKDKSYFHTKEIHDNQLAQ